MVDLPTERRAVLELHKGRDPRRQVVPSDATRLQDFDELTPLERARWRSRSRRRGSQQQTTTAVVGRGDKLSLNRLPSEQGARERSVPTFVRRLLDKTAWLICCLKHACCCLASRTRLSSEA